jgi:hypothetical protein
LNAVKEPPRRFPRHFLCAEARFQEADFGIEFRNLNPLVKIVLVKRALMEPGLGVLEILRFDEGDIALPVPVLVAQQAGERDLAVRL